MKPIMVALLIIAAAITASAGTELKLLKGSVQIQNLSQTFNLGHDESNDFVVQFKEVIKPADKAALRSAGLKIQRYLPEDAFIVSGRLSDVQKFVHANPGVLAFSRFQADWKLSDNLPVISLFARGQSSLVLISAFSEKERANLELKILNVNPSAVILNSDGRYLALKTEITQLPQIAKLSGIEFIQKIEKMEPLHMVLDSEDGDVGSTEAPDYAALTGNETGTKVMKFDSIWAQGFHGEGEIASMADTGLDSGDMKSVSPDFAGAIPVGYAFGVGAKDWSDPMGHGTHVAGSVMSRGVSSGGRIKGGAYAASFIPEGIWSPILDNLSIPPQLNKLFEAAHKDGARIHTNSWGAAANFGAYESMAQKVDEFLFNNPEMLILFAAGNSGVDKNKDGKIDANSVGTPGTAKNCLTVGASENVTKTGGIQVPISKLKVAKENWSAEPIFSSYLSDNENGVAMFSSRGPTRDNRIKPDIVAPGTNILSNRSHVKDSSPLWGAYGDDYAWSGGTSMATPLTAGAATIVRQVLKSKFNVSAPSGALVKAVLMHTATDMYPGQYGEGVPAQELTRRPNNDEGYGRVNMQTVSELGSTTKLIDEKAGVSQGQKTSYSVQLSKPGKLLVNMVYADAPGSPTASKTLVNNIDLVVTGPDGKELSSKDATNNHEIVEISNASAGSYKIEVHGVNVPMGKDGKQPFALVYSVY